MTLNRTLASTIRLFVLWLFWQVGPVAPFSSGVVGVACGSMNPFHFPFGPQQLPNPYSVYASMNQDGTLDVTLTGAYQAYKGFLMHALTEDDDVIGKFLAAPPSSRILDCIHKGSSVSHNGTDLKQHLTFHWSPEGYIGPVTFRATVVQSYSRHWRDIEASYVIAKLPIDDVTTEANLEYDSDEELEYTTEDILSNAITTINVDV